MSFIDKDDIKSTYNESKLEAHLWRQSYPAFERLADNDLMDGMDENLPEVNDGSLAAALFKLPKRIVSSKLAGFAKAIDRDEAWINELANLTWKKEIIPHANSQAPFHRKWKDAVRKSAIYGSVPIITLFVKRGNYTGADFIVAQPQDVTLEPGKVSDYDSDVIFWDVYYTKIQLEAMIEQAKDETKDKGKKKDDNDADEYNKWDIPAMQSILDSKNQEERSSLDSPRQENDKKRPSGFKFTIAFQRGVDAPFYMHHPGMNKTVREWSNPDPTGDVPIHFLYCYQDFINPYGIGIVKLAGGTQNVLDYMRQADVLATQLGLRPPIAIEGNEDEVDIDSIVYAQDAIWFTGGAKVVRQELANGVYDRLPDRIAMYKTSLNALIPTGDTSIGTGAGDPNYSKTPAGVRFQGSQLSIDDDDFKDNLFITYEAVARSMINTHFANMEGSDILKLSDEEKASLNKIDPVQFAPFMAQPNEQGQTPDTTNQLEIIWDTVRAKFDFEIDPSTAIVSNDIDQAAAIQELLKTITLPAAYYLSQDGWKFSMGEAYRSLLTKMNIENIDQILTKMTDEEKTEAKNAKFPIIDMPQIRLMGQIPNGAMGAALNMGGVYIDPNESDLQDKMNLGDLYKDPSTGDSVKAQIQQMAGIQQPEVVPVAPATPTTDPNQQAAVQQTQDMAAQQQAHQQQLDAAKLSVEQQKVDLTAQHQNHTQNMDLVREHNSADPMAMAQLKANQAKAKPTVGVK